MLHIDVATRTHGAQREVDSFRAGKQEMKLGIKPAAETAGLTLQNLGRQVRQAFYGRGGPADPAGAATTYV